MRFEVGFFGHANIRSLHPRTIEITRDSDLTPGGDCVVGVGADRACSDIPAEMGDRLRDPHARVEIAIRVGKMIFELAGRGDPAISLTHTRDIVMRQSGFVCPRTLAVGCDAASDSVPREMVSALRDPDARGTLSIRV